MNHQIIHDVHKKLCINKYRHLRFCHEFKEAFDYSKTKQDTIIIETSDKTFPFEVVSTETVLYLI
jgi:hypothetical protein